MTEMTEEQEQNVAGSMLFAFSHGIRLGLEACGKTIDDPETASRLLRRMNRITEDPKASLVAYHDDIDGEHSDTMRGIEAELCKAYLAEVDERQTT